MKRSGTERNKTKTLNIYTACGELCVSCLINISIPAYCYLSIRRRKYANFNGVWLENSNFFKVSFHAVIYRFTESISINKFRMILIFCLSDRDKAGFFRPRREENERDRERTKYSDERERGRTGENEKEQESRRLERF